MSRIVFAVECACGGTGVRRPDRPGIDWPTACACKGRRFHTQYTIGRLIDESPSTIARVDAVRSRSAICARVLDKIVPMLANL